MHFIQSFWVLLLKDFLIALRNPIWTAVQLAIPLGATLLVFRGLEEAKELPSWRNEHDYIRDYPYADQTGLWDDYDMFNRKVYEMKHNISRNRSGGSQSFRRRRHIMHMPYGDQNTFRKEQFRIVKYTEYRNQKRLRLQQCSKCDLYYINSGHDKEAIQTVIDRVPWRSKRKFSSKAKLLETLKEIEIERRFNSGLVTVIGLEFEKLDGNKFSYHVHSVHTAETVVEALRLAPSIPLFSSELTPHNLSIARDERGDNVVAGIIEACLIAGKEEKIGENKTLFEYDDNCGFNVYEAKDIRVPLELLSRYAPILFGPVAIFTAMNTANEKKQGMKDFLLVMGLKRTTLFLESFIFSLLKAFFVAAFISIRLLFTLPTDTIPVIVLSIILISIGAVALGMLCAAVVKTGNSALTVSLLLLMALAYVMIQGIDLYEPDFLHYVCLLDIFAAYESLLSGIRLCYVRGVKEISVALFAYDDVVNVGTSFVFLFLGTLLMMVIVLICDFISVKPLIAYCAKFASKTQTDAEISEVDDSSWHEEYRGTGEQVLIVDSVSKIWETTGEPAVERFSMEAYRGQVTVLLGHNGAGKSTVYAMVCGLTPVTRGDIIVLGSSFCNNIFADRPVLGYCPQTNCIYNSLTVEDHLRLFFALKRGEGYWKDEADLLCTQLDMAILAKRKAGQLSGGEKRKLCLAMAFIGGSQLVMLDEPTVGMDPQSRAVVKKVIEEKKKKIAIVLTTHYLDEAEAMGDFVYILQTGRCVCSGTPYFIKAKFAPEIILSVVFSNNASEEDVEAASKIIEDVIDGAQMGEITGNQARFKLPKDQQDRYPKLIANLENEKSANIESFGLSMNALEEAFLKVGELKGTKASWNSEAFINDPDVASLHESKTAMILQQILYLCLKRLFDTIYNMPLIINQWIIPVVMAVVIGFATRGDSTRYETYRVEDMSLRRVSGGRFLIYDPWNNANKRELLEKALQKYPRIEVLRYNSSYNSGLWPSTYPWPVGGAIIKSEENISKGENPYKWLIPIYLYHKEELLFQLISDVEFAAGQLELRVSFTTSVHKYQEYDKLFFIMSGLLFCFACVFLNTSFITLLIEEKVSNFQYQQILAGLSPLVFWATTFVMDVCVVVIVMMFVVLVLILLTSSASWMLM